MEQRPYVSCIKINGVSILPPLITDDVRAEMHYYKNLAIAVEERLKTLQATKQFKAQGCMGDIAKDGKTCGDEIFKSESSDSPDESTTTESHSVTANSTPNAVTVIDVPTREEGHSVGELESCYTASENALESSARVWNGDGSCQNDATLVDSVSSDTVTGSTDLNQYLNESSSTRTNTAESTPELWKPQVPKTLDIVPITVEFPKPRDATSNESQTLESDGETPKLVRQGSYVLDTPSPMLLAHLQIELAHSNYVPTPSTNTAKRKEWNITQAKTEWENQIKNKELTIPDSSRTATGFRSRRNSASGLSSQKVGKSAAHLKGGSSMSARQSARSVDCIQSILEKEFVCKASNDRVVNNCGQRHNSGVASKNHSSPKWKSSKNTISILNLANKLGGSLGSLSNAATQSYRCTAKKQGDVVSKNKSPDRELAGDRVARDSPGPLKSSGTSERLLNIFKEIQGTHEKQMAELVARQRSEQLSMQKEFEKQQVLLLTQIKKSFPEVSIPLFSETTSGTVSEDVKSDAEDASQSKSVDVASKERNTSSLPSVQNGNDSRCAMNESCPAKIKCPLDYIYPLNGQNATRCRTNGTISEPVFTDANHFGSNNSLSAGETSLHKSKSNCHYSNEKIPCLERRSSNVSRQLFPLDSRTIHVPVVCSRVYEDKHVKAATTINAYARGYLVRRMMRTESVIALKNTYREALLCMLKLHVDAPLNLAELDFHQRLQFQCDAASMNIVELFAASADKRMQVIAHDREIKRSRAERPSSARSYSFATQRTLARKKLKEMGEYPSPSPISRPCSARTRCQTWASNAREKRASNVIYPSIKRSTSAGTVRKPWR